MTDNAKQTIKNIRKSIVKMSHYSKSSHIGSALSMVEILYTLYFEVANVSPETITRPDRDIFILSKAHGSMGLYAVLAERGYFPKTHLDRYYIDDGLLPGHLDATRVPGVEFSTGSLGHGLPVAQGIALADRLDNRNRRIFVLIGDGECNEGSVWEGVMLAAAQKLSALTVIIDHNKLQGYGQSAIKQDNLAERFRVFGWQSTEADGHHIKELKKVLSQTSDLPKVVIANTVKGKGVSYMENQLAWHYKSPDDKQLEQAIREITNSD